MSHLFWRRQSQCVNYNLFAVSFDECLKWGVFHTLRRHIYAVTVVHDIIIIVQAKYLPRATISTRIIYRFWIKRNMKQKRGRGRINEYWEMSGGQRKNIIKERNRGIRRQIMSSIYVILTFMSSERNQFTPYPSYPLPQQHTVHTELMFTSRRIS